MDVVNTESEELANSIDAGTALSIELASTATFGAAPMLLAARKRRNQLNLDPLAANSGGGGGRKSASSLKFRRRSNLNAFGDSEDEGDDDAAGEDDDDEDDDDDDNEDERAAALIGGSSELSLGGPLDLFRLRQLQRAK